MRLRTLLDGAGPITLSSNMLDATLNRFKHSSNISSTFFHVGWYCMRFRAHPPCWINILERKMSISIKFESSNARMPIRFSFVRWVVSFVLQYGLTKWRKSRAKKRNYQKWQKEMDRWWSPRFDWTASEENLFVGYFFEQVLKEGGERKSL